MSPPHAEHPSGFEIRVDDSRDAISLIVLNGELDLATSPKLTEAISELTERREPVVLDVAGVSFVDSSGVRALIESDQALAARGRRLALLRPGPALVRLLELVDMRAQFMEIDGLGPDALARLTESPEIGRKEND